MKDRRDNKGRILHNGELQMPDGRYRFKYTDSTGKVRCVYSYRLDRHDRMPRDIKKCGPSIREMARSGMNPKTLQYLMGHADIGVTLNTYSHVGFEDAVAEVTRLGIV